MKKFSLVLGMIFMSLVVTACNPANEPPSINTEDRDEIESIDVEESSDPDADTVKNNDEDNYHNEGDQALDYTEEQVAGEFLIYGDWLDGADLMLYFTRTTDEMTREERFHQSLIESDPSQRDLFSEVVDFEVDGSVANLYFNEKDDLSMASTESAQFWEVLREIGFRYGIEEVNLFNQDGERGLTFAENTWEEPVEIEQDPNRGYYVMPAEESERGEYTYISSAAAGEEIYTEDGELLDFGQTVEAMATVRNDEESYYPGIYEGLEIEEAMIDGNQAIVKYHISDGVEASQRAREDFEQVLQLAALDFQVEELRIVNETDQVISVYPLLNELEDSNNVSADEDSNSEDKSDMNGEEDTALSEEDAPGKVFDYVDEHENYDREDVKAMVQDDEDEEGKFLVQAFVYSGENDDEAQMTNTIGWYLVDKETGEVEEREL